ncbi:hypothetical protein [uncultured Tateyamaria sp.]|nr:hypothetical protein [uncultured Tateyamaria sp.]
MNLLLDYFWMLPVAIGVAGVYHFAMQDLAPAPARARVQNKTKG